MNAKALFKIAIIGGSGLYEIDGVDNIDEVTVETPFGFPSDSIITGTYQGIPIAFLPRHGKGHRITPSELPARANIYALKMLGVERIISVSAVGSLRAEISPLDMVVPDQLIDRTRLRGNTFFGDGIVGHISFGSPFCINTSKLLVDSAKLVGAKVHEGGTYVVMEGPAFSTKAESHTYRSWGASIIGMTALPEAKLAREAEICYSTLACVTDYDVWHESEAEVTVEMIIQNLLKNVAKSKETLRILIPKLANLERNCECESALANAIITSPETIPQNTKERLAAIIGRYIS